MNINQENARTGLRYGAKRWQGGFVDYPPLLLSLGAAAIILGFVGGCYYKARQRLSDPLNALSVPTTNSQAHLLAQ